MNSTKLFLKIIKTINGHPLAGRHRLLGYYRLCRWQLVSRLTRRWVAVPFTPKCKLAVKKGMTGATGNIYMGLHDFPEMAFLLHFLRPGDLFMDIGANVGSYSVLASAHVGCRSIAFEPVPATFGALQTNMALNRINNRVQAMQVAVGAQPGLVSMTASFDTVNHIVSEKMGVPSTLIQVPVVTVDDTAETTAVPSLVKIDVEGFEWEVLQGMQKTVANKTLKAVIIELNGSGAKYGYSEANIHDWLLHHRFRPFTYDPFNRKLNEMETYGCYNTLYLRDLAQVKDRLAFGPAVTVFKETF